MTLEPTITANHLDPITANPVPARASVGHVITINQDGSIGTYYVRQHDTCTCVNNSGAAYLSVRVMGHGVLEQWELGKSYQVWFSPNCYDLTAWPPSTEADRGDPRATNGKLHVSAPPQRLPSDG